MGFFCSYWGVAGSCGFVFGYFLSYLLREFSNFYSFVKIKTSLLLFVGLFTYLLFVNVLGLIPYVFACSAHFVFSLRLGFPL
jgi:hypothetical protein